MGSDFNRRKNGENLKITKSWENDAGVKWQKMNFMPITAPDLFPSKKKQIYRFYWEKVFSAPSTATLMKLKSFVVRKFETTRWEKGSKSNCKGGRASQVRKDNKNYRKVHHSDHSPIRDPNPLLLLLHSSRSQTTTKPSHKQFILCHSFVQAAQKKEEKSYELMWKNSEAHKWSGAGEMNKKTQHWVSPWHIATLGWLSSDSHELFT